MTFYEMVGTTTSTDTPVGALSAEDREELRALVTDISDISPATRAGFEARIQRAYENSWKVAQGHLSPLSL